MAFACQFPKYRYTRLHTIQYSFSRDLIQQQIDEIIFKDMQNIFGIADDILIVGYDENGCDHDTTWRQVMQICKKEKFKRKMFQVHSVPILQRDYSQKWSATLRNVVYLQKCPLPKMKRFLSISRCNELPQQVFTTNYRGV